MLPRIWAESRGPHTSRYIRRTAQTFWAILSIAFNILPARLPRRTRYAEFQRAAHVVSTVRRWTPAIPEYSVPY